MGTDKSKEIRKVKDFIHTFTNYGAGFRAYAKAMSSYNVRLDREKTIKLINDCAKMCLDVRNYILNNCGGLVDDDE